MGSNSGLTLGMDWELDWTYRPQSSGQIKRIKRMLKETLTKFSLESREGRECRSPSLSFALGLQHPIYKERFTPYEIMLERPLRLLHRLRGQQLADSLTIPFSGQGSVHWTTQRAQPAWVQHQFLLVWIWWYCLDQADSQGMLELASKGFYMVTLSTPIAVSSSCHYTIDPPHSGQESGR